MAENETQGERPLPAGWVWTTIGETCEVNPRMTRPEQFGDETPVSFVPMAAVDEFSGAIVNPKARPIGEVWRGYKRFADGDVIFAKITPCMENGKAAIATGLLNGIGLGSTEFHVLRPPGDILPQWIYYFVRQVSFRGDAAAEMTGTAGQLRVPTRFMQKAAIPLAPLPEQRRIVAEIETQFTRLDAGVAALERAQANLRRYKASVLKAACEGRLVPTEADLARAENRAYEPAGQLLARILAERRARWEAEHPGKKYKEPSPPDTENLPELPEGWVWASVGQLAENIQYGYTESAKGNPVGPKFLRITDIQNGRVNWDTVPYCKCPEEKHAKYRLKPSDIVFARTGATTGKNYLITHCPDAVFASYLIRLQMNKSLNVKYLASFLDSPLYWPQIMTVRKGSAQPGVNATILATLHVPLPPLAEQHRIAAEVERRLSVVAALEASVEAGLTRARRLRQSILKRAFEGRLAPQDPDDKPASVLLERVRR